MITEKSLSVLRAVAAAMPGGISRKALADKLPEMSSKDLDQRVHNLKQCGYLLREGKGPAGCWKATGKEPAQPGTDSDTHALWPKREAPKGVPPGVPNSVFALGDMARAPAPASASAEEPDPVHSAIASMAITQAPHRAPGTRAPQPAAKGLHARARAPAALALPLPPLPAAAPPQGTRAPAVALGPKFELHSDSVLVIDPAGDGSEPIALQPTVTRALFRWLDQLAGLSLQRLVADEEAAA